MAEEVLSRKKQTNLIPKQAIIFIYNYFDSLIIFPSNLFK